MYLTYIEEVEFEMYKQLFATVLIVSFLAASCAHGFSIFHRQKLVPSDPFTPGEYPINHTTILNALNIFSDTNLDVYAPNVPGHFPVFYFVTGLTGEFRILTTKASLFLKISLL